MKTGGHKVVKIKDGSSYFPDPNQLELFEPEPPKQLPYERLDRIALVKEFSSTFDPPTNEAFCIKLIHEEALEVAEAAAHLLKELADLNYVMTYAIQCGVDYLDATTVDNITRLHAHWQEQLDPVIQDEAFKRVHLSNMSKLTAEGKVLRRSDGKVLKSDLYQEPHLMDLV